MRNLLIVYNIIFLSFGNVLFSSIHYLHDHHHSDEIHEDHECKECIIIDPGCYTKKEEEEINDFITTRKLHPIKLINTHCHIDHILGNNYDY